MKNLIALCLSANYKLLVNYMCSSIPNISALAIARKLIKLVMLQLAVGDVFPCDWHQASVSLLGRAGVQSYLQHFHKTSQRLASFLKLASTADACRRRWRRMDPLQHHARVTHSCRVAYRARHAGFQPCRVVGG